MSGLFPVNSGPRVDHDLEAALARLRSHRDQCLVDNTCFKLPITSIRKITGTTSSAKVRDLLRAGASPARIHPDDHESPWIDLLAAFFLPGESGTIPVLVLASSSRTLFDTISNRHPSGASLIQGGDERSRLLDLAANDLQRFVGKFGKGGAHAGDVTVLMATLASAATHLLFVCSDKDIKAVKAIVGDFEVHFKTCDSLAEFLARDLTACRSILGTGWLPRIRHFQDAIKKAASLQDSPRYVLADSPQSTGDWPEVLAAVAAGRMAMFGWLPCQWSPTGILGKPHKPGSFVRSVGGELTDGDVSVFKLPRISHRAEMELGIKELSKRQAESWIHFQSKHTDDQVLVYLEFRGNGSHGGKQIEPGQPQRESWRFQTLGHLHISSVSILRRLLPSITINMVAYSESASRTTRSAVLDSLIRLVRCNPNDLASNDELRTEVMALLKADELGRPRISLLERCLEIEARIAASKHEPDGASIKNPVSSRVMTIIGKLLERGKTGQGNLADSLKLAANLVSIVLNLRSENLEALIEGPDGDPVNDAKAIKVLKQTVTAAAVDDRDVHRTRGSRFHLLALRKDIAILFWNACRGKLVVPDLLAEWLTKYVRITCVAPIDRVFPTPGKQRLSKYRPLPGSFHSYTAYGKLITHEPFDSSIAVDLDPLLWPAVRALTHGSKDSEMGWLANKISQTNELSAALLCRIGHVEDFNLDQLLKRGRLGRNPHLMLPYLDSATVVRCVLREGSGRESLKTWGDNLMTDVQNHWHSTSGDLGRFSNRDSINSLLTIFLDYQGMAAAALDCARDSIRNSADNPDENLKLQVFLSPDCVAEVFYSRHANRTRGVRLYIDGS